jgi:hypothetical protein
MRAPPPDSDDEVHELVMQILRTGLMLSDLMCTLIESTPEDAFGDERRADVLIEMLTGTIRPVAEAAGDGAVQDAQALLGAIADRTVADLEKALEIARRREVGA